MDQDTLTALAKRVDGMTSGDNAVDVLVEIALFTPDERYAAIRANTAGSKVICTTQDGSKETFRARDWTFTAGHRRNVSALLRARTQESTPC